MVTPIDVREIDLAYAVPTLHGLTGHTVQMLVRWYGTPLGSVQIVVSDGVCSAAAIRQAIREQFSEEAARLVVRAALPYLASADSERWVAACFQIGRI